MCNLLQDFDGQDNTLARLQSYLPEGQRAKCLLAQPIQAHNTDKVMGVLVAVNKQEQDGEQDIFFEPVFTDADW